MKSKFKPKLWEIIFAWFQNLAGNSSNEVQTILVNRILDEIEKMDENQLKERVVVTKFTLTYILSDGSGSIELWTANEYYYSGHTYGQTLMNLNLPNDTFPNIRTRIRLQKVYRSIFDERTGTGKFLKDAVKNMEL